MPFKDKADKKRYMDIYNPIYYRVNKKRLLQKRRVRYLEAKGDKIMASLKTTLDYPKDRITVSNILRCIAAHLITAGQDERGNTQLFFQDCIKCSDITLCRPLRQKIEEVLNG